jgi:hypothetical protein
MNLALVTSYIIAAMLMLSIIMMNLRLSSSSAELTLTQMTRQHMVTVADMLNDDIPNMGYNVDSKTDIIIRCAQDHRIQFFRNIKDDPDYPPHRITWEFDTDSSLLDQLLNKNEDVGVLRRITRDTNTGVEETTEIMTGVTKFRLRYYVNQGDSLHNNISAPDCTYPTNIRQIYLELEMQSLEALPMRGNPEGRHIRSVYEKRFTPRNLE